jgi:hypothetical protein
MALLTCPEDHQEPEVRVVPSKDHKESHHLVHHQTTSRRCLCPEVQLVLHPVPTSQIPLRLLCQMVSQIPSSIPMYPLEVLPVTPLL